MEATKPSRNRKKRPFKQTKELVRLALNDGWTQDDIATSCRTQQSVVSSWNKGAKFGREEQLRPLLELYGHKLRRQSFKLYNVFNGLVWSSSSYGAPSPDDFKQRMAAIGTHFAKFEGPVILDKVFWENPGRKNAKPVYRLCVHAIGRGTFHLLLSLFSAQTNTDPRRNENWTVFQKALYIDQAELICCLDFLAELSQHTLLERVRGGEGLGYLIRSALLNHGYPVDDVVTHPANW